MTDNYDKLCKGLVTQRLASFGIFTPSDASKNISWQETVSCA